MSSPFAGKISEILANEGSEINVGAPLFVVLEGATGSSRPITTSAPTTTSSPAVEKKAAPTTQPVSTKETQAPTKAAPAKSAPGVSSSAAVVEKGSRSETRVKMTRMRQRIAQRLKESQSVAAMLTTFQEVG